MGSHIWLSHHGSCITSKLKPWFFVLNMIVVVKPVEKNRVVESFWWCLVTSDSFRPHGLQYTRLPCPSLSPGVCSGSCPLSRWCHPTISSSVIPFSSCPPSFPVSGSFLLSQLFASGGQSIRASASVLPMNIQGWFLLRLTGLISLLSKRLWSVFSSTIIWKHQFFGAQPSLWSNSHIYTILLEKT